VLDRHVPNRVMVQTSTDAALRAIRAAWLRYLVVLVGVGLVVVSALWVMWPRPYYFAVERFMLPQYETRLGFQGGRVPVTWGEGTFTVYGFVAVHAGGVMARAGVRPGDIPVEYHSGLADFYSAVQDFDSGDPGQFEVLAKSDWQDWSKRRRIVLVPPTPNPGP
jgi:hypothetical protein